MRKYIFIILFSIFLFGCASTNNVEKKPRIDSDNRKLEAAFKNYGGYDVLVERGFDIHSLDYIKNQAEFIYALQPYWYDEDGNPLDNHFGYYNEKDYYDTTAGGLQVLRKFSNVCFEDKYGTKEELLNEGYIENKTMFYYPSNGEKDWRVGYWNSGIDNNSKYADNFKHTYSQLNHGNYGFYGDEDCIIIKIFNHKENDNFSEFFSEAEDVNVIIVDLTNDGGGSILSGVNFINSLKLLENKKIYILISNYTASCGEMIASNMKNCPNTKIIGIDTEGTVKYAINYISYSFPKLGIKNIYLPCLFIDEYYNNASSLIKEGVGLLPNYWAINYIDMENSIEFDLGEDYFSWSKERKLSDMIGKCH